MTPATILAPQPSAIRGLLGREEPLYLRVARANRHVGRVGGNRREREDAKVGCLKFGGD